MEDVSARSSTTDRSLAQPMPRRRAVRVLDGGLQPSPGDEAAGEGVLRGPEERWGGSPQVHNFSRRSPSSRITARIPVASLVRLARTAAALTIVLMTPTLSVACSSQPQPPPTATLQEVETDISRGGRSVAVTVSPADTQSAIVAGESGGLFRTNDRGNTWRHVDS